MDIGWPPGRPAWRTARAFLLACARGVVTGAGFTRFRRAAEMPFNSVLEARP